MNNGGRKHRDSRVPMVVVVPGEETAAVRDGVLITTKSIGIGWSIFERLEVRLGEGVVVRNARPTVRDLNAEVSVELRDGF